MGVAMLGSHKFRLDPTTINWSYTIKAKDFKAVGGKVIQVFGATLGDMTMEGDFGVGGWKEQHTFLESMRTLAASQIATATTVSSRPDAKPLRFRYPPHGWDFLVYLTAFTQPGASTSVSLTNETFAPRWSLTMSIVEDNAGLREVAMNQYLARLAQGIGWKQTEYNGFLSESEAMQAVGGNVEGFIADYFGVTESMTQAASGTATTSGTAPEQTQ